MGARWPTTLEEDPRYEAEGASDVELAAHAAETEDVHGIVDTALLVVDGDPRLSDARTPLSHSHTIAGVTGLQSALDAKQPAGSYVLDSDARLTDSRTPLPHNHAISDVTGLQGALDATESYTDAAIDALVANAPGALDTLNEIATQLADDESAVAALTTTVAGKQDAATAATDAELTAGLANKSNTGHSHVISDVTNLQSSLDAKQDASSAATDTELTAAVAGVVTLSPATATRNVITPTADVLSFVLRQIAGQTANMMEWQNSAGSQLGRITSGGSGVFPTVFLSGSRIFAETTSTGAFMTLNPNSADTGAMVINTRQSANIGLLIRGVTSQTGNLLQLENSGGTQLFRFTGGGNLLLSSGGTLFSNIIGDTAATGSTITMNPSGTNSGAVQATARSAGGMPLAAKGFASQTADLIGALNSANTLLWCINKDGIPSWVAGSNNQTTVGPAGGASALPATPTSYLKVRNSAGTTLVVPAYAAS